MLQRITGSDAVVGIEYQQFLQKKIKIISNNPVSFVILGTSSSQKFTKNCSSKRDIILCKKLRTHSRSEKLTPKIASSHFFLSFIKKNVRSTHNQDTILNLTLSNFTFLVKHWDHGKI